MGKVVALLILMCVSVSAFAQSVSFQGYQATPWSLPGPYKAGRYYGPEFHVGPTNTALAAAATLYAEPFYVGASSVLKTLNFDIGTGIAGAWNARMCVYYDSGSGSPAGLVPNSDAGTIAIGSGSVTGVETSTLNSGNGITLSGPGWYWLAFMADTSGQSVYSFSGGGPVVAQLLGDSIAAGIYNGVANYAYSMAQTFGACPGSMSTATVARNTAIVFIEAGF